MNTKTIINDQIKTIENLSLNALTYLFSEEITPITEEQQELYKRLCNKHLGTDYKKDDIITAEEVKYLLAVTKEVEMVSKKKISYESKMQSLSSKINKSEKRLPQLF